METIWSKRRSCSGEPSETDREGDRALGKSCGFLIRRGGLAGLVTGLGWSESGNGGPALNALATAMLLMSFVVAGLGYVGTRHDPRPAGRGPGPAGAVHHHRHD